MKRIILSVAAGVLLLPNFAISQDKTFTGEIMDSQCAKLGSHAMMLKKSGMGDQDPNSPMAKKMCSQECVKMGGKYVLYDSARKIVYQLDDQQKPANFAGQKVSVTGSYDQTTKTIHVSNLQPAS